MSDWTCLSCGRRSPEGTRFCGHCGTPAAQAPATWACRVCGTANPEGNAFCGGCGERAQTVRSEELRLVTALFADISGFTTLADSLDVESLHEVITPLVGGLSRVAERYGGFIEKFAGDALLVVYGAPVTHEDDAQRALRTALDMHAELPRLLAEIGPYAEHLTIHVGVNTGRVIGRQAGSEQQSDYAVLGDSVILAQRLESVCPPGETYVGATTYDLCKQEFEFEPLGELALKGKLVAAQAFRLLGPRRADEPSAPARPLIGREHELQQLDAVLDQVAAGRGALAVVVGEPGTGKSRLVAESGAHAADRGVEWRVARCLSYGASLPYWPFADLVRQSLGASPGEEPDTTRTRIEAALPSACASGVRRLLGVVDDAAEPQLARREVHEAVLTWLSSVARSSPLVLCVEDVHWLDGASQELLAELLLVLPGTAMGVVLTTRPEAVEEMTALLRIRSAQTLVLGALEPSAVPQLAHAVLGAPVAPDVAQLLAERTGGNPLFVQELLRAMRDGGALTSTAGGWQLAPSHDMETVPESVERVFATRLDALPVPAAALIQMMSVIGRTVRLSLLAAVADDEREALATLAGLVSAGLLERTQDAGEPAVTFHHALLHDVVYGRLLRKRRRELHRRVADVARALYGDGDDVVGLLARHLYLAEAGAEAVGFLLRAGRRAAGLYANDEAALHLERAVEVLASLPETGSAELAAVRLELAEVHEIRGQYDAAHRLFEDERLSSDDPRAWRGVMAVRRLQGEYVPVTELFVQATSRLDATAATTLPLWLECANALALLGRFSDSVSMLRTVLRLPAATDPGLRGEALTRLAWAESQLGLGAEARAHADEAVDLLEAVGRLQPLTSALRVAGGVHADHGEPAQATALLDRGFSVAQRLGLLVEAAGCLVNAGFVDLTRDPAAAAPRFRTALDLFRRLGNAGGECAALANLADALSRTGDLDEALSVGEQAFAVATRIGHQLGRADTLLTLARIAFARDEPSRAAELAGDSAELFDELDLQAQRDEARALRDRAIGATG